MNRAPVGVSCTECGVAFPHRPMRLPSKGDVVGDRYRVLGPLARGGRGWLQLAADEAPPAEGQDGGAAPGAGGRLVVLKELIPRAGHDVSPEREFGTLIDHPHIVGIRDIVTDGRRERDAVDYLVMEYVEGATLSEVIRAAKAGGPPLLAEQVIAFGIQILDVLGYLHRLGLLYCDLKPGNVILQGGHIKLIDLGAVRRVDDRDSPVIGTPRYQVPESEMRTYGLTVRSDLYTVGTTLRELVEASRTEGEGHGDEGDGVLRALHHVLNRATASYVKRYALAEEMSQHLSRALEHLLSEQRSYTEPTRAALEEAVEAGSTAYDARRPVRAAREWGRAVALASALEDRAVPRLLRHVVDIIDPVRGVVRVKGTSTARSGAATEPQHPTTSRRGDAPFEDAGMDVLGDAVLDLDSTPSRVAMPAPPSVNFRQGVGSIWGEASVQWAPPALTYSESFPSWRLGLPRQPPELAVPDRPFHTEPYIQRLGDEPARVGVPATVAFALVAPAVGELSDAPEPLPEAVKLRVLLDARGAAVTWPVTRLVELRADRTTEVVDFDVVPAEAGELGLTFRIYRDVDSELLMEVQAELDVTGDVGVPAGQWGSRE
ncbi:serine/threonine protein kinase [Streptomyces sp. N2-109]|uniref:non-specific serine/threonine protein kinase n=1 Tax=Streptomyces gossypii TaxID=2883101 RepID=A0ABT2JNT2_9ACTN|nr:serine/threonine-protein kinase [Streptomyces gossypii]MCT2589538.1 serine/threonine protein kinase [Streptomyces gossypii]